MLWCMNDSLSPALSRRDLCIWAGMALFLYLVLKLHLLPALLAGLFVFEVVKLMAPRLKLGGLSPARRQLVAVSLIALAVIATLVAVIAGIAGLLRHSGESLPALLERMAQILDDARGRMPAWLVDYVPDSADELSAALTGWLRVHAASLQIAGTELGRGLAHLLIGMIAAALISLHLAEPFARRPPLAALLTEQSGKLSGAFRNVVFAQFRISALNTVFTWIYISIALPAFGVDLPLRGTLVAITFAFGMLPILGNLLSNAVIVIFSLSHSLSMALISLAYLVVIHKLEYFLNARIIGAQIRARAWELLIAMLIMEAAFGIPGLIAAPIFYSYFKDSLREKGLV